MIGTTDEDAGLLGESGKVVEAGKDGGHGGSIGMVREALHPKSDQMMNDGLCYSAEDSLLAIRQRPWSVHNVIIALYRE